MLSCAFLSIPLTNLQVSGHPQFCHPEEPRDLRFHLIPSQCCRQQLFQPLANCSWKRHPTLVIPSAAEGPAVSLALQQPLDGGYRCTGNCGGAKNAALSG